MYGLIAAYVGIRRLRKYQGSQSPRLDGGGFPEVSPLMRGGIGNWWQMGVRKSILFKDMSPEKLPTFQ